MEYKIKARKNAFKWLNVLPCVLWLLLSACNGGGNSSGGSGGGSDVTPLTPPTNPNVSVAVTANVDSSVCGYYNAPCVTVTICVPGTSTCDTIPNVLLDSGSYGLRVFSSLLTNTGSSLPIETFDGESLAECVKYADDSANWGPVAMANITLNGTSTIESIPMQIINAAYANLPEDCAGATNDSTPASFHLNGIIGVGPYTNDSISGN